MALQDPTTPGYVPPVSFWDDDLERQLAAYAAGAPVDPPAPGVIPPTTVALPAEASQPAPAPEPTPPPQASAPVPPPDLGVPMSHDEVPVAAWVQANTPPPEQPLNVDAISGGAPQVQQVVEQQSADAGGPVAGQTLGTPDMPDDYLSDEELGAAWSQLPIEEQEAQRSRIEGQRQALLQAGMVNADTQALKDAHANAEIYATAVKQAQQKQAQLDVEAQQLANEKIDPLRDISTGQKIAGVLAAFIGGFAMKSTGRNVGLEQIDAMINDSIQAQTANLNNRKDLLARRGNAIAEQLAMGKDLYQAQETVRLATYDQLVKKLQTEVQQYDPRGTKALRMMDTINAIQAQRADQLAKYRKDELDRAERLLKEERERAQLLETQRHNLAGEKNDATRAYADLLRAKTEGKKADAEAGGTDRFDADGLRAQGIAIPEGVVLPAGGWTIKQAKAVADTAKSVEDWRKAARENSPEELNRQYAVGEIFDESGKPIKFRNPEKVAKVMTATDQIVQLTDRMITARQKYGWSSDLLKSPEWRQMQADFAQLMLEKKNLDELGVIAGPDMDLMTKAAGTTDPTEVRDPIAGLTRLRQNTVSKANSLIHYEAPPGTKFKYAPPPPPPEAPQSPLQETVQRLLEYDPKRVTSEESRELRAAGENALVHPNAVPPSYRDAIDRLVAVFNSSSATQKERDEAGAHLRALQEHARSSAIRDYAEKATTGGAFSSIPTSGPLE